MKRPVLSLAVSTVALLHHSSSLAIHEQRSLTEDLPFATCDNICHRNFTFSDSDNNTTCAEDARVVGDLLRCKDSCLTSNIFSLDDCIDSELASPHCDTTSALCEAVSSFPNSSDHNRCFADCAAQVDPLFSAAWRDCDQAFAYLSRFVDCLETRCGNSLSAAARDCDEYLEAFDSELVAACGVCERLHAAEPGVVLDGYDPRPNFFVVFIAILGSAMAMALCVAFIRQHVTQEASGEGGGGGFVDALAVKAQNLVG